MRTVRVQFGFIFFKNCPTTLSDLAILFSSVNSRLSFRSFHLQNSASNVLDLMEFNQA